MEVGRNISSANISNINLSSFDNVNDIGNFTEKRILQNFVLFLIGVVLLVADCLTCVAMSKTRRVPFATRYLTCLSLVLDSVFVFLLTISVPIKTFDVQLNSHLYAVCVQIGRLCISSSWVTLTLMSMERVFCLNFTNYYTAKFDKRRTARYLSSAVLFCAAIKVFVRFVVVPLRDNARVSDYSAMRDLPINTWILGSCVIISSFCYLNTEYIVRKHVSRFRLTKTKEQRMRSKNMYTSTRATSVLFIIFLLLHIPLLITLICLHVANDVRFSRFLATLWMLVTCIVDPAVYAWRFAECRYVIFSALHRKFGLFSRNVTILRINVFDIVISESRVDHVKFGQENCDAK